VVSTGATSLFPSWCRRFDFDKGWHPRRRPRSFLGMRCCWCFQGNEPFLRFAADRLDILQLLQARDLLSGQSLLHAKWEGLGDVRTVESDWKGLQFLVGSISLYNEFCSGYSLSSIKYELMPHIWGWGTSEVRKRSIPIPSCNTPAYCYRHPCNPP
jgi:hypothetical protein